MEPKFADERTAAGRLTISLLAAFRDAILEGRYQYTEHAKQRAAERNVSHGDVMAVVREGEFCYARRAEGQVRGIY